MPPNQIEVKLKFPRRRSAKVMGTLADRETEPIEGENVRGILVTHNFHSKIVSPKDLSTYTPLRVGSIASKLHVPFMGSIETLKLFLNEMFAGVTEENLIVKDEIDNNNMIPKAFHLHGGQVRIFIYFNTTKRQKDNYWFAWLFSSIQVKIKTGIKKGVATVEWQASPAGDVIADSVVALLMHAQSSTASIRLSSKPCRHSIDAGLAENEQISKKQRDDMNEEVESRLRFVHSLLKDQFRHVEVVYEGNKASYEIVTDSGLESTIALDEDGKLKCNITVDIDKDFGNNAKVSIECQDKKMATNIQTTIRNALATFDKI